MKPRSLSDRGRVNLKLLQDLNFQSRRICGGTFIFYSDCPKRERPGKAEIEVWIYKKGIRILLNIKILRAG